MMLNDIMTSAATSPGPGKSENLVERRRPLRGPHDNVHKNYY